MRNITMQKFVPKGQWIVGSSVSYSQSEQKDYNFLVIESVSGEGYSFKSARSYVMLLQITWEQADVLPINGP